MTSEERLNELEARLTLLPLAVAWPPTPSDECLGAPHRGPQGPNEDIAQCPSCWSVDYAMRPANETFGDHLDDCSLPIRHESYCQPGGKGHPRAAKIRG